MVIGNEGITGLPDAGEFQNKMANCEFIGRPSYNPFWTQQGEPNDDIGPMGWTSGHGMTYSNLSIGTGPWDGKVYEFCGKTNAGECALKPDSSGQEYSGIRGPVGLHSREPFSVDIYKLAGVTVQNFGPPDGCCHPTIPDPCPPL